MFCNSHQGFIAESSSRCLYCRVICGTLGVLGKFNITFVTYTLLGSYSHGVICDPVGSPRVVFKTVHCVFTEVCSVVLCMQLRRVESFDLIPSQLAFRKMNMLR